MIDQDTRDATECIELGEVSTQTKGGVDHMIEDRDPLV